MKKKLFIALLAMFVALPAMSQSIVDSFMKGKEETCGRINISGKMLRMMANADSTMDNDAKEMFENVDKISIITGLEVEEWDKQSLRKLLKNYEELLSIIDGDQNIYMYTKDNKKYTEEFVACIYTGDTLLLISITGKIDVNKLAELSDSVGIEGLDSLKKIND
ncbi:NAD(P)H-hydrate repair Nnr-like enzyme with NAD(P)H-hydrate dehydratase domain [Dysgonomonadaceae bacterium PH5-43]|nr:NAD(P)H-hydrate repair Nnr-like enzyme with NAD(P)H-hydrate dehydratase domain [Dysgonomonadaceae bacterium PH5-43]